MLNILTTYFLTFLTTWNFAQSVDTLKIQGRVVSSTKGTPVSGGSIITTKDKATSSGYDGEFKISGLRQGKHKISFRSVGYYKKDTTINMENSTENFVLTVVPKCSDYFVASKDIKRGRAKILTDREVMEDLSLTDREFEKKYGVSFNFPELIVPPEECIVDYNKNVFEFLDNKFGKKWREEIRKDILGLK